MDVFRPVTQRYAVITPHLGIPPHILQFVDLDIRPPQFSITPDALTQCLMFSGAGLSTVIHPASCPFPCIHISGAHKTRGKAWYWKGSISPVKRQSVVVSQQNKVADELPRSIQLINITHNQSPNWY